MSQPIDDAALDTLFRTGRSYNGYLDRPVTTEQLHEIWDIMKWGPTSANQLPARIIWCMSDEAKTRLAECVSEGNRQKVLRAPVTAIVGHDVNFHEYLPELFPHTDAKSWFDGNAELRETSAFRNGTLQGAYLLLAARAIGLDTGPMSGFDTAQVDAAFFADTPGVRTNFLTTLGYGDPDTIFDRSPRPAFEKFNRIA